MKNVMTNYTKRLIVICKLNQLHKYKIKSKHNTKSCIKYLNATKSRNRALSKKDKCIFQVFIPGHVKPNEELLVVDKHPKNEWTMHNHHSLFIIQNRTV